MTDIIKALTIQEIKDEVATYKHNNGKPFEITDEQAADIQKRLIYGFNDYMCEVIRDYIMDGEFDE